MSARSAQLNHHNHPKTRLNFGLDQLVDGDIASNQHCWPWSAGSGTDAAPYFRVFNPANEKLDPSGDYIRRWVAELGAVDDVHLRHGERPRATHHR